MTTEEYARRDALFGSIDPEGLDADFPPAFANPANQAVYRDACCHMPYGLLATLTGHDRCDALDRIHAAFCAGIMRAGEFFPNWQAAWRAFEESLKARGQ